MGTPIPTNSAHFEAEALARVTGAEVLQGSLAELGAVTGVSTDTRTLSPGALFVALRGDRFDAHDHLAAAWEKGAKAALVERDVKAPEGMTVLRVASTLGALAALAKAHVASWRALGGERRIIGITGSAGKTTTRVATTALFERLRPGEVHATRGNLNNQVGVPMVLLGLLPRHRFAVVEMGMNQPGEIAELAAMATPDAGIVTLVAAAHVEGLGSIEAVAHEKGALLRALGEDGIAVGNGDDERVMKELEGSLARHKFRYGVRPGLELRIVERKPEGLDRSRVTLSRATDPGRPIVFATPLIGEAGALACAAAIAVAEALLGARVTSLEAEEAFVQADVGAGGGRLLPRMLGNEVAVIDDSYNANPASSCASIRAASELSLASNRRLLLVLGAMFELGVEDERGHDEVGRAAGGSGAAEVFAIHGSARRIAERAAEAGVPARFFPTSEAAARAVVDAVRPGDLLLVKGSRGVATERVVRALVDALGEVAGEVTA
jgi:UDP-N-acetylmuramoyl-tripeptide--D-alanyl-D-alanine ligase